MQKKIIALAVAAVASGAAFAQTNVVISGNLNYQLENISASNPTVSLPAGNIGFMSREGRNRVNENSSEIKFSVTEDLGNGLKAGVIIATGIQPTDTGVSYPNASGAGGGSNSRGSIGGRDTFMTLGGSFGTIAAGRMSVHYNSQAGIDNFNANTALAASSLAILNNVGGSYGANIGGRLPNTVAYITPTVNGFNATFGYARPNASASASNGITAVAQTGGGTNVTKESGWTVKGNFDNGPISAFMSYLAHNDIGITALPTLWSGANAAAGVVAGSGNYNAEVRSFRMGAGYTFPMGLKVGLIYDNSKQIMRDTTGNAIPLDDDLSIKRTAWVIPVSMAFGQHTIGATYGKAANLTISGSVPTSAPAVTGVDSDATAARYWMLGYQYAFSKRTNMGVTFARVDNDARSGYDFFSNAAAGINAATTGGSQMRGSDPTSVSIGLKHSF